MKRNMDLVRKILLELNECDGITAPNNFEITNYTSDEVGYHCLILHEAGLIQAVPSGVTYSARPLRLTWSGHEFIANASNDKVWSQSKDAIAKLGDVSFSVWASVLSKVVTDSLGLSGS